MKNEDTGYTLRQTLSAHAFNAPLVILTAVFIVIPVAGTLVSSLQRDVTFLPARFVGLANFGRVLHDPHFWQAVQFTILFVLISVVAELVLGMIAALTLHETFAGRGAARAITLLPWVVPIAIAARVWQLITNYDYGVLNTLVTQSGLGSAPVNWLGTAGGALAALVISDVWKTTPFVGIILLAGLSTIPPDLYKQAMVDGTRADQRFRSITLPLIRPAIMVALLFRTIDAVRIFDLSYVLTGGGPGGSTTPLSLYAFRLYLSGDFGAGSAVSVVVFLLAAILSIAYLKVGRFREVLR